MEKLKLPKHKVGMKTLDQLMIKSLGKDGKIKNKFINFLYMNPDLRFWQAVRNFSKYPFILGSTHFDTEMFNEKWKKKHKDFNIKDAFYRREGINRKGKGVGA